MFKESLQLIDMLLPLTFCHKSVHWAIAYVICTIEHSLHVEKNVYDISIKSIKYCVKRFTDQGLKKKRKLK